MSDNDKHRDLKKTEGPSSSTILRAMKKASKVTIARKAVV